jgi:hypothetical protein
MPAAFAHRIGKFTAGIAEKAADENSCVFMPRKVRATDGPEGRALF